jgi:hypothetical protein
MLGVVIGVSSVITMVALGTGAEQAVRDQLARLGTTVIWITFRRSIDESVWNGKCFLRPRLPPRGAYVEQTPPLQEGVTQQHAPASPLDPRGGVFERAGGERKRGLRSGVSRVSYRGFRIRPGPF